MRKPRVKGEPDTVCEFTDSSTKQSRYYSHIVTGQSSDSIAQIANTRPFPIYSNRSKVAPNPRQVRCSYFLATLVSLKVDEIGADRSLGCNLNKKPQPRRPGRKRAVSRQDPRVG